MFCAIRWSRSWVKDKFYKTVVSAAMVYGSACSAIDRKISRDEHFKVNEWKN